MVLLEKQRPESPAIVWILGRQTPLPPREGERRRKAQGCRAWVRSRPWSWRPWWDSWVEISSPGLLYVV